MGDPRDRSTPQIADANRQRLSLSTVGLVSSLARQMTDAIARSVRRGEVCAAFELSLRMCLGQPVLWEARRAGFPDGLVGGS